MTQTPIICPITTTTADDDYEGEPLECDLGLFHTGAHHTIVPVDPPHASAPDGPDYWWGKGLGDLLPVTQRDIDGFGYVELIPILETYREHWAAIQDRLFQSFAHHMSDEQADDQARALMEQAEREVLNGEEIIQERRFLYGGIEKIANGAREALRALGRLEAGDVYDVEYAEGQRARDIQTFLEEIRIRAVALEAMLVTNEHGNMKP